MDPAETFEQLRPQLLAFSYRALGARADAEDVVQEAYLRWQAADRSGVASPKAFLMKVVARLAIDHLKSARVKREEYVGVWLPEPVRSEFGGAEEAADRQLIMSESLTIAFLFVLESLGPAERAAFLLHDVFGMGYDGIADALETSLANARQLVSRARKHVRERRPWSGGAMDQDRQRDLLREFVEACVTDDPERLKRMLAEDVASYSDGGGKAAAALNPIYGADRVARFFTGLAKKASEGEWGWRIEEWNGSPVLALLQDHAVISLITFDLDGDGRVAQVLVHRNPDKIGS